MYVVCCCQKWVSEKFENFTGRLLSTGLNHPYDKSCAFRVACTLGFVKNTKHVVWACFQAPNPTSNTRRGGTCTPKNFIFKNHLIYYMEHLPATLYIFRTPTAPCTHYLRKNVLFQNRPLRAKYDDLSYEIRKSLLAARRFLSTFLTTLDTSKKFINFILVNICIMLAKNHNCASRAQKGYPTHSHENAYFLKNII